MFKNNYTLKNLEEISNSICMGIIEVDSMGTITFVNTNTEKILKIKSDKILYKNIRSIFPQIKYLSKEIKQNNVIKEKLFINNKLIQMIKLPLQIGNNINGAMILIKDETKNIELIDSLNKYKDTCELLETIIEMTYDGLVVVNKDGYVKMLSKVYADFLGIDKNKAIGRHVTEVIENTRMHVVARTGLRENIDLQKIGGRYIIANRVPIIKDGQPYGAIGKMLFKNLKSFDTFSKKIYTIEKQIKKCKQNSSKNNIAVYSFDNIIGKSSAIEKTKDIAKKAALTTSNVLLVGESGTGKELFAHSIHKASDRSYGNFIKVNCAAIPNELLESELFGYERGSFTGANKEGKIGKFELADGGTIFLDEIGDMPLSMQVKLLRIIQEKEVERIGAGYTKKIDIRIIAATNRDLAQMVEKGEFRQDLYYRLNVVTITIPPLRDRKDDIDTLIDYSIKKISKKLNKQIKGITPEAIEYMRNYSWQGNVRELENVIEMAINIINIQEKIDVEHLPKSITGRRIESKVEKLDDIMNRAEKNAILNALTICKGNKSKTAKMLNISRTTLYEKMDKHDIVS